MKQRLYVAVSLLSLSVVVTGQSKPLHSTQTTPPGASAPTQPRPQAYQSKSVSKAPQAKPKYLTESLDLRQTNLSTNFLGHDIVAVVNAIKNSPALKEKSEFESTSAFQTRRSGFIDQPLYASLMPTGHFAFVVEDSVYAPAFKYDADAQTMGVTVSGRTIQFVLDRDNATLDTILIRRISEDRDSYLGSNSFGASVKVDRTYSNEFGVAFDQANWLFRSSRPFLPRKFDFLLAMGPEEAKAVKADLKLLLVCRLIEPWFHHGAHGHDPTVSEPYETLVGESYLQVSPEQVWVFNSRTGEVVKKLN